MTLKNEIDYASYQNNCFWPIWLLGDNLLLCQIIWTLLPLINYNLSRKIGIIFYRNLKPLLVYGNTLLKRKFITLCFFQWFIEKSACYIWRICVVECSMLTDGRKSVKGVNNKPLVDIAYLKKVYYVHYIFIQIWS